MVCRTKSSCDPNWAGDSSGVNLIWTPLGFTSSLLRTDRQAERQRKIYNIEIEERERQIRFGAPWVLHLRFYGETERKREGHSDLQRQRREKGTVHTMINNKMITLPIFQCWKKPGISEEKKPNHLGFLGEWYFSCFIFVLFFCLIFSAFYGIFFEFLFKFSLSILSI